MRSPSPSPDRPWPAKLAGLCAGALFAVAALGPAGAADFPGAGHKFIADFAKFRFEQVYPDASRLTWTTLNADGSRGQSETVAVRVQQVAGGVFMVSWQEANKTTVVQVQDYGKHVIFTNLTMPDGTFVQLQGKFTPAD